VINVKFESVTFIARSNLEKCLLITLQMKNPTRTYKVTVPNGAVPGQPFQVYLDEQTSITITCPHNAHPGTLLEIDAHDVGPQYQRVVEVHRPHVLAAEEAEQFRERKVKRRRGSLYVWVFFAMVLSLFLILAYSVPKVHNCLQSVGEHQPLVKT
jgi:hypothetical protein